MKGSENMIFRLITPEIAENIARYFHQKGRFSRRDMEKSYEELAPVEFLDNMERKNYHHHGGALYINGIDWYHFLVDTKQKLLVLRKKNYKNKYTFLSISYQYLESDEEPLKWDIEKSMFVESGEAHGSVMIPPGAKIQN